LFAYIGFWGGSQVFSDQNYKIANDNFYIVPGTVFVSEYTFGALVAVAVCFAAFFAIKKPKINLTNKNSQLRIFFENMTDT